MDLSIVATLYCSAPHLKEFYDRVRAAAAKVAGEFEIVLVNDGSPDCSLEVALRLQTDDPRVVVVDLARNFVVDNRFVAVGIDDWFGKGPRS